MKEFMTVEDVAELLTVHPQTIRKWVRKGEITGADTSAGYRFTPADIHAWMEKHREKRPPRPRGINARKQQDKIENSPNER